MPNDPVITLTTDFGLDDAYVGVMKGVLLRICPQCRLVDLTHSVPQGDILKASLVLRSAAGFFPAGTVHLAVVDPGVGGNRLPVAIHAGNKYFVGPDNGLFWFLTRRDPPPRAVVLEKRTYFLPKTSTTFHGRDVFAPVAAHLASGVPLSEFGPQTRALTSLSVPDVVREASGRMRGQVIYIDHFGNCVTNLSPEELGCDLSSHWIVVLEDGSRIPVGAYYGQVEEGHPLALVGSSGHLELAVRNGSAEKELALRLGSEFILSMP
jgi:S-adenosylmethionine hydrolase